jgi:hypothetical protein
MLRSLDTVAYEALQGGQESWIGAGRSSCVMPKPLRRPTDAVQESIELAIRDVRRNAYGRCEGESLGRGHGRAHRAKQSRAASLREPGLSLVERFRVRDAPNPKYIGVFVLYFLAYIAPLVDAAWSTPRLCSNQKRNRVAPGFVGAPSNAGAANIVVAYPEKKKADLPNNAVPMISDECLWREQS